MDSARQRRRSSDKIVPSGAPSERVVRELAAYFNRKGYVRRQNAERLSREGYLAYKKGDEVRLTSQSPEELARIRTLLQRAGFRPGKAFVKGRQYRQPVYGREAVRRFLELIDV